MSEINLSTRKHRLDLAKKMDTNSSILKEILDLDKNSSVIKAILRNQNASEELLLEIYQLTLNPPTDYKGPSLDYIFFEAMTYRFAHPQSIKEILLTDTRVPEFFPEYASLDFITEEQVKTAMRNHPEFLEAIIIFHDYREKYMTIEIHKIYLDLLNEVLKEIEVNELPALARMSDYLFMDLYISPEGEELTLEQKIANLTAIAYNLHDSSHLSNKVTDAIESIFHFSDPQLSK